MASDVVSGGAAADAVFVEEWRKRSVCMNWSPVWLYRRRVARTARGVVRPGIVCHGEVVEVRFAEVADERLVRRLSRVCERQYLAQISERREAYVRAASARGASELEALVKFERELCKADLFYLSKFILGYDKEVFHFHRYMAGTMEGLPPGYRGLREFPRDAFKSTVMTISFMVQQVLRNPEVKILLKSNAEGNAAKKMAEAREHFIPSAAGTAPEAAKKLPRLFPEFAPTSKDELGSGTYWKVKTARRVSKEGTFEASGVGSSKVSQHYDIVIGDDFWDDKSVTSAEVTAKTNKELDSLDYLLASPAEGIIVFIGTRFAYDDPTAAFLADPAYHCVIVSGVMPCGRSVFPESLTLRAYQSQARRNLYVFSCQVMLSPKTADAALKREWIGFLRYEEVRAAELAGQLKTRVVLLTDCAVEGKSKNDNAVILAVVIDNRGRKLVAEAVREPLDPSVYIARVGQMWDKWRPEFCVRQKTALETTVQNFFREEDKRRLGAGKDPVRFYDYSLGKREKKARITASLQPRMQSGEIFLDPGLPQLASIEQEIIQHPNSHKDDFLDALAVLDDPVVSRLPEFAEARPAPPTEYLPEVPGADEAEKFYRRTSAAEAFAFARRPSGRKPMGRVMQ